MKDCNLLDWRCRLCASAKRPFDHETKLLTTTAFWDMLQLHLSSDFASENAYLRVSHYSISDYQSAAFQFSSLNTSHLDSSYVSFPLWSPMLAATGSSSYTLFLDNPPTRRSARGSAGALSFALKSRFRNFRINYYE